MWRNWRTTRIATATLPAFDPCLALLNVHKRSISTEDVLVIEEARAISADTCERVIVVLNVKLSRPHTPGAVG